MINNVYFKMAMKKKSTSPVSAMSWERMAARFRVMGDPTRLRLLATLQEGERSVSDLILATEGRQANISRHLQSLHSGGVVARRKEGTRVFYSIADPTVLELCHCLCRGARQPPPAPLL